MSRKAFGKTGRVLLEIDKDELFELKCQLHDANKKIESLEAELSFLESLYKVAIKERDYERQVNANLLRGLN